MLLVVIEPNHVESAATPSSTLAEGSGLRLAS